MRRILCGLIMTLASNSLTAQTQQRPPQSARQALIEMFLGKGENDLAKHLPDVARKALIHKDETPQSSIVLRVAAIGHTLAAEGQQIQTFDTGPNILVTEQPDRHQRVEIAVEHDSLMGEQDEIELSFHEYKDGQEQALPVIPRVIFTLQQEEEVWRLTEITVAGHIPLTDPDYLKVLRKQQDDANEQMAQMRMNMLIGAEKTQVADHPEVGYTCSLSSLMPQKTEGPEGGGSFDPGQGNEEWNGYRFNLSGCGGTPSSKYRLTAVPIDPESQGKTFCTDESGNMKFVTGGKPSSCFSGGQPLNRSAPSNFVIDD